MLWSIRDSGRRPGKALSLLCLEGDTLHIGHRWRWPAHRGEVFGVRLCRIVLCRRCGAGFAFGAWPKGKGPTV